MSHVATAARPRDARVFYGWWIVAASVVCLATSSGVQQWSFGAFVPELEKEFGWSRAEVATAPSLAFLSLALGAPLVGLWVDRLSIRFGVLFGATMTGLCFASLSQVHEIWQFYALYFVSNFFRIWTTYIPFSTLMNRWFLRNRGKAVGLSTAGYGLGGVVFAPLVTYLVHALGWRSAYMASGLILFLTIAPLALLIIRDRPADRGLEPDGDRATEVVTDRGRSAPPLSWSLRQAMHDRTFWVLNVAILLLWISQVSYGVHAQPFFESEGYEAGVAATLLGASTLGAAIARAASGFVFDRFPSPRVFIFLLSCCLCTAYVTLSFSAAPLALGVFFLFFALGSGGSPIVPPLMLARYYGSRHLGALLGFTELTSSVMLVGPILGGVIFDATGSYQVALAMYGSTVLCSGVLFLVARPPAPRH